MISTVDDSVYIPDLSKYGIRVVQNDKKFFISSINDDEEDYGIITIGIQIGMKFENRREPFEITNYLEWAKTNFPILHLHAKIAVDLINTDEKDREIELSIAQRQLFLWLKKAKSVLFLENNKQRNRGKMRWIDFEIQPSHFSE